MREILFRGKSNYGNVGEWEYGLVAQPHVTEDGIVTSYYFTKLCEDGHSSQGTVSASTIGQYTGLTDKNGTKIFEGDIVRYDNTINEVVFEQRNGSAYFGVVIDDTETWCFCYLTDAKIMEVIGNIHDNPELLKGGAE